MMKLENIRVYGILDAVRGMRNPLNSWAKNDTTCTFDPTYGNVTSVKFGPNDEKLCRALTHGGSPHRKFLRQISVTMDITAPTYWWAEMDTYKISTTRNSCSLQHKGASREYTIDDFTFDGPDYPTKNSIDLFENSQLEKDKSTMLEIVNRWRNKYIENKDDYTYFRIMRQFIPMGYNYKATWSGNYEILLNIYEWRKNHKLVEWIKFCENIATLPGMDIFIDTLQTNKE